MSTSVEYNVCMIIQWRKGKVHTYIDEERGHGDTILSVVLPQHASTWTNSDIEKWYVNKPFHSWFLVVCCKAMRRHFYRYLQNISVHHPQSSYPPHLTSAAGYIDIMPGMSDGKVSGRVGRPAIFPAYTLTFSFNSRSNAF